MAMQLWPGPMGKQEGKGSGGNEHGEETRPRAVQFAVERVETRAGHSLGRDLRRSPLPSLVMKTGLYSLQLTFAGPDYSPNYGLGRGGAFQISYHTVSITFGCSSDAIAHKENGERSVTGLDHCPQWHVSQSHHCFVTWCKVLQIPLFLILQFLAAGFQPAAFPGASEKIMSGGGLQAPARLLRPSES
ncbi:uncharacterized protein VTP21DRAFT_922 [Calcarisporiella thermophila]|uniref:uncharacterized protein n=1 Tax=Calcarisporiella thermophila TaxID=911321 RepID=UPI0037433858